jgi:hypothetical protein
LDGLADFHWMVWLVFVRQFGGIFLRGSTNCAWLSLNLRFNRKRGLYFRQPAKCGKKSEIWLCDGRIAIKAALI